MTTRPPAPLVGMHTLGRTFKPPAFHAGKPSDQAGVERALPMALAGLSSVPA